MTMALCFECGEVKFGAICPCPRCQVSSTGDMSLDILFSDHNFAVETLKGFGKVVQVIRARCEDRETGFWAFLDFVSTRHPDILTIRLDPQMQSAISLALGDVDLPGVEVRTCGMRAEPGRIREDGPSD